MVRPNAIVIAFGFPLDLKERVRLGILLSSGAEIVALVRHILAVPLHTVFGVV